MELVLYEKGFSEATDKMFYTSFVRGQSKCTRRVNKLCHIPKEQYHSKQNKTSKTTPTKYESLRYYCHIPLRLEHIVRCNFHI